MTAQTAIIDVKYVNPPKDGKQYGSIKSTNNDSWPVKKDRIHEFEPGSSYELAYTEGNNGFRNIIGVKRIAGDAEPQALEGTFTPVQGNGHNGVMVAPRQATPVKPKAAPAAQNNATQYYRPTAPKDARRMFLTATLGHFIETGRLDCNAQSIADAMVEILGAYDAVIGREDER